jgi:hypothetical protein
MFIFNFPKQLNLIKVLKRLSFRQLPKLFLIKIYTQKCRELMFDWNTIPENRLTWAVLLNLGRIEGWLACFLLQISWSGLALESWLGEVNLLHFSYSNPTNTFISPQPKGWETINLNKAKKRDFRVKMKPFQKIPRNNSEFIVFFSFPPQFSCLLFRPEDYNIKKPFTFFRKLPFVLTLPN